MVIASYRSADHRQAAARKSDDWARRGEPERTGSCISRGATRHSRRGQAAAGQPRDGSGRRRGDRFATHFTARQAPGSSGRAEEMCRRVHAACDSRFGRRCNGKSRLERRDRAGARIEWRKMGSRPAKDIHSSLKAMVDSPAWHLVKALNTLVSDDGNQIMIDNYPKPLPPTAEEKAMIEEVSKVRSEAQAKKQFSVQHWINNLPWEQANERLESQPTVNIEGLVGGYTGPGGKTVLPHRAVAKIDMRLVPDMKAADAVAALKAHLAKRGFGDIEVNMTGGYDPTATSKDSALIQAQLAT